jgi:hypothetical protein
MSHITTASYSTLPESRPGKWEQRPFPIFNQFLDPDSLELTKYLILQHYRAIKEHSMTEREAYFLKHGALMLWHGFQTTMPQATLAQSGPDDRHCCGGQAHAHSVKNTDLPFTTVSWPTYCVNTGAA